ncbi:Major facilitator superfamily domain, general substrate transporter [Penicillium expansum]|uniref:Major facilitator superfamily domain, general substrate transporter n=1 Tax=Penicillium expansum TaxID=27334 RepID=A0A0A2KGU3_PENEN|nr:Major facilitator superfamily domain, general substrate transporter [Penicillium expansum]KAJ5501166.1 Major facilitator superfamily domain general substrate transporter [Penicillium expansum]KGO41490.1 Major facilitator superfamily domain, general substrate transporter [Penicillium expansum]KGO62490.1 Major facilitator superfamily domain, general substrate transporter [Penicillium expansum]KGO67014.1 Major facilitator superfamily domain, general substrate transporter [Penicillium expansum]
MAEPKASDPITPVDGLPEYGYSSTAGPASDSSMTKVIQNAKAATEKEQSMTLMQGIRLYPKAVLWSVLISTCIAMEGYDISLVNNFYAFPQFKRKYGERLANGTYEVSAAWQAGLSNGAYCGEIIGLFINGWASERFGYRYTIMACLILVSAWTSIFFTAQNVHALLAAEILCGVPWGVFQTLTITYASEVCPVALRGYLTTYVNFCWGLGQLIGIGVIKGMLSRTDEWAYRIPYGLQWMWPLPLFIGIWLAPESPWWLVRKGRTEDAKRALVRLTSKSQGDFDPEETVSMMVHTTALEEKITKGASYLDCFRGTDLRRTEIVCMVWAIQNLSGNSFSNYSTYFLEQAGLSSSNSYSFAMGQYGINMVGVFGSWFLMTLGIGRRTLYLYGLCGLCTMLLVMGFLGLVPKEHKNQGSLATGAMMLIWALFYQLTVGTVCFSLVAELSTRRLQIKTVVLGRNLYNIVAIVCGVLTPYMLNPGAWNWGNYAGFFWGGICFLCIIYTYFRVPEPRGRSFAELDLLFERGVSARKFATTQVDVFDETVEGRVIDDYRAEKNTRIDESQLEKNPSSI